MQPLIMQIFADQEKRQHRCGSSLRTSLLTLSCESIPASNSVSDSTHLGRQLIAFIERNAGTRNFVKHLVLETDEPWDFYHWQGLKFFLASYEQDLCQQHSQHKSISELLQGRNPRAYNDFFQKEHILAQGDDTVRGEEADFLKRRLGNFVLLSEGTNKGAGCMSVKEKIEFGYNSQGTIELYQLAELRDLFDAGQTYVEQHRQRINHTWKYWAEVLRRMFDLRERKLVDFALKRWGIDQLPDEPVTVRVDNFAEGSEVFTIQRL